ncbi:MAG TPA: hypothetical protein VFR34_11460 [Paracoccaceae bacterium]|nr:hypothetical protein [Paracoccaceae bacterium]
MRMKRSLGAAGGWLRLGLLQRQILTASAEVILRRSLLLQSGRMSRREAVRMLTEKPATFLKAAEAATKAALAGKKPAAIASAALKPVHGRAASNARRLRRGLGT